MITGDCWTLESLVAYRPVCEVSLPVRRTVFRSVVSAIFRTPAKVLHATNNEKQRFLPYFLFLL